MYPYQIYFGSIEKPIAGFINRDDADFYCQYLNAQSHSKGYRVVVV